MPSNKGMHSDRLPTYEELEQLRLMIEGQHGINPLDTRFPSPFDDRQLYDYLAALRGGMTLKPDPLDGGRMHGSSKYKHPSHPNRFVPGEDAGRHGGVYDTLHEVPISPGKMSPEQLRNMMLNIERGLSRAE